MAFSIPGVWCIKETEKAICVEAHEVEPGLTWIPKSQIHDNSEVWKSDQNGELLVSDWFADQRGWS